MLPGRAPRRGSVLAGPGVIHHHREAGRELLRHIPPHHLVIKCRGRDELPLIAGPSRAAIGTIDFRGPSASIPRTQLARRPLILSRQPAEHLRSQARQLRSDLWGYGLMGTWGAERCLSTKVQVSEVGRIRFIRI